MLQEALGMEVLLLVNVEKTDTAALEACWLYPYHFHYNKSCAGVFKREYQDSVFQGYQCVVNQAHQSEVCRMLQMVADWKPECVWSIGGNSVINDLLGEITTLVASSCVNNYAVSEAELLVCFAKGSMGEIGEAETYIRAGRQRIVDVAVSFLFSHGREDKEPLPLFAGEKELLSYKWLIAIVGNRLEEIPALVGRYIHDAQFLESQKAICRKRQATPYAQDSLAEYRKVLCAVKELG